MKMARLYHDLHIFSRVPGDVVVYAWEDAEHDITFVAIEAAADEFGAVERSRVVISLRTYDYPAFAQMVCEALSVPVTDEGSEKP